MPKFSNRKNTEALSGGLLQQTIKLRECQELLDMATAFTVWEAPESSYAITVEKRAEDKWAVLHSPFVFDIKAKAFVYEPLPSSRTDEFKSLTRFSFQDAMKIAKQIAVIYEKAYQDWVQDKSKYFRSPQPVDYNNVMI